MSNDAPLGAARAKHNARARTGDDNRTDSGQGAERLLGAGLEKHTLGSESEDDRRWRREVSSQRSSQATPLIELEVLLPSLNEEHRIGLTLEKLSNYLATRGLRAVITVIDNGSSDRTVDVVTAFSSSAPVPVNVVGCARRGKGAAVRKAVLRSTARWVGFCDADLSTPIETLDRVLSALRAGADIVVASRRCAGASYAERQPLVRRVGGFGFRYLTSSYAPSVSDTQCGFKFFEREAARQLFSRATIDGFAFDVEVLGLAHASGKTIVEVPVAWRDANRSSFRIWQDGQRVARDVIELRKIFARDEVGQQTPSSLV